MRDNTTIKFKLAELLEAVAIIGVLVAISIPIFTSQLEKSREAVDLANIRAAYAEVASEGLLDDQYTGTKTVTVTGSTDGWQTTGDKVCGEIDISTLPVTNGDTITISWVAPTASAEGHVQIAEGSVTLPTT